MSQAGIIGIEPEQVLQAARLLERYSGDLGDAGGRLQVVGVPPPTSLPGGAGAAALALAAARIGGAGDAEGTVTRDAALALHRFVDAVVDADTTSATSLAGVE
ncbi:hypothetical protein [Corynebacterium terpenotabidum]|uniref:Uncharacterized protein n=1 Tax=Corynebacterium terpenotabidum Y-11 TaxID=1200352 RepID=S4XA05_9CORY|nr:hypothetical protein [Corynebacterium terpenotabidum]AGP29942.1 hypothetical protein A606_01435 [Corynebacterium terpenotabidum Y-11]